VLLDRRHKTAKPVIKPFFPVGKLSDLHSCKLEVHYDVLARIPSSKAVARRWYDFVSFLLKAMNAEDKPPLRNTPYTMFKENMKGVGVSLFVRFPNAWDLHVFFSDNPTSSLRTLCAKTAQPISSVQLFRIFHEFSYEVWCCIFFVFCVSVSYVYVVLREKRSLPYAILLCFKTLLNVATKLQIFRARDRLFLSLWLVVCLVLNAAYQSKLVGDLTFRTSADAIENLADFWQSDIEVRVPIEFYQNVKDFVSMTPKDAALMEKVTFSSALSHGSRLRFLASFVLFHYT